MSRSKFRAADAAPLHRLCGADPGDDHVPPQKVNLFSSKIEAKSAIRCSSKIFSLTNRSRGNVDEVINAAVLAGFAEMGIVKKKNTRCKILQV